MRDLIPVVDSETNPWVHRLLKEEALRCPECGSAQSMLHILSENRLIAPRYVVACRECFYEGLFAKDVMSAIKKWNKGKPRNVSAWLQGVAKNWKRHPQKRPVF